MAQNQLKDANKKVKELRSKVDKITEENERLKTLQKSKEQVRACFLLQGIYYFLHFNLLEVSAILRFVE